MTLQTRYIQQRGSVFQFVMRVPNDLLARVDWKTHKKAGDTDFVVAVERDWKKPLLALADGSVAEVGCPKDILDAIQGHENGEVA